MLQMLDRNEQLPLPDAETISQLAAEAEIPTGTTPVPKTGSTAPLKIDPVMEARQRAMARLAAQLFDISEDNSPEGLIYRRGSAAPGADLVVFHRKTQTAPASSSTLGRRSNCRAREMTWGRSKPLEQALEIGLQTPDVFFDLGYILSTQDGQKSFRYLQESVKHPDYCAGILSADRPAL